MEIPTTANVTLAQDKYLDELARNIAEEIQRRRRDTDPEEAWRSYLLGSGMHQYICYAVNDHKIWKALEIKTCVFVHEGFHWTRIKS